MPIFLTAFMCSNVLFMKFKKKKKNPQVRIRVRQLCKALEEDAFRPVLHHYDGPKFRLELSIPEVIKFRCLWLLTMYYVWKPDSPRAELGYSSSPFLLVFQQWNPFRSKPASLYYLGKFYSCRSHTHVVWLPFSYFSRVLDFITVILKGLNFSTS